MIGRRQLMAGSLAGLLGAAPRPGPPLKVKTLDGRTVEVRSLKGKVVLLDFMTTVCPSCKMASAGLQKLYEEYGAKGFQPMGLALNVDDPATLESYRREYGLSFPLGVVSREDVAAYLNHPAGERFLVPTLALLDRGGRIVSVTVGWNGEDEVRSAIVKLLGK
ncbi:MAG: TlpA family protein disulfide reductase [Bryobacter sp.]|jgi:peroxiredoxin|nr:TlpA family protein disulfide reductase [Bryobacter sp.]